MEDKGRRRGVAEEGKIISMCYVHVPNPQSECNYYILQTCATKIKTKVKKADKI